jgi:hypothetical protein
MINTRLGRGGQRRHRRSTSTSWRGISYGRLRMIPIPMQVTYPAPNMVSAHNIDNVSTPKNPTKSLSLLSVPSGRLPRKTETLLGQRETLAVVPANPKRLWQAEPSLPLQRTCLGIDCTLCTSMASESINPDPQKCCKSQPFKSCLIAGIRREAFLQRETLLDARETDPKEEHC